MPIIRSSTTAVAASGLPLERGGSSAVGRGRADHDQQHHVVVVGHIRVATVTVCESRHNWSANGVSAFIFKITYFRHMCQFAIRQHGTTRLPLGEFLRNFILVGFY